MNLCSEAAAEATCSVVVPERAHGGVWVAVVTIESRCQGVASALSVLRVTDGVAWRSAFELGGHGQGARFVVRGVHDAGSGLLVEHGHESSGRDQCADRDRREDTLTVCVDLVDPEQWRCAMVPLRLMSSCEVHARDDADCIGACGHGTADQQPFVLGYFLDGPEIALERQSGDIPPRLAPVLGRRTAIGLIEAIANL